MLNKIKEIHLTNGNEVYKKINIQPVVLFSILDHYIRREKDGDRIVGTMMGTIEDGIVIVNSCFVVPHTEPPLKFNFEVHTNRVRLHCEINPYDIIVGWFSTTITTSKENMSTNALISDFYLKEMECPPVLLSIDPTLQDSELSIRCYVSYNIQLTERGVVQQQFKPVKHSLQTHQPERLLFERMAECKGKELTPLSDLEALERSLESTISMLDKISNHFGKVSKGQIQGNSELARQVEKTLALIPETSSEFENAFSKGVQDVLMVAYLAELTRIHLLISESNIAEHHQQS